MPYVFQSWGAAHPAPGRVARAQQGLVAPWWGQAGRWGQPQPKLRLQQWGAGPQGLALAGRARSIDSPRQGKCQTRPGIQLGRPENLTWHLPDFFTYRICHVHDIVSEREEGLWVWGQLFPWLQRGLWLCVLLEKKLSARKETSDGVALGLDLMLPLLCFSGRSARREVKQATVDTRLGGTANRVRAGILYEGLMNKHED